MLHYVILVILSRSAATALAASPPPSLLNDADSYFSISIGKEVKNPDLRLTQVKQGLSRLLERYYSLLGVDQTRERLRDLGSNQPFPFAKGKIPVFYFDHVHPHNFNPGSPYPLLVISEVDHGGSDGRATVSEVVTHEGGHLILGKFNDGLAEPIANLASRRPMPPRTELEGLAALTLATRQPDSALPEFGLKTLMSYVPSFRHELCQSYRTEIKEHRADPDGGKQAAVRAVRRKYGEELSEDFQSARPEFEGGTPASTDSEPESDPGAQLYANPSPNEGPWAARGVLYDLGWLMMRYLARRAGGDFGKLLRFYYAPSDQTLSQEFGLTGGFRQLEDEIRSALEKKYRAFLASGAWKRYLHEMESFACFHKENWPKRECIFPQSANGPIGQRYPRLERNALKHATEQCRADSPEPALKPPKGGFSVTARLGTNWDLEKFCSPSLTSGMVIRPIAHSDRPSVQKTGNPASIH